MPPLLNYFVRLCLLKASPADAPGSLNVMYGCIFAYVISSMLASIRILPLSQVLISEACKALIFFLVLRTALRVAGKDARLVQTATAYFGSAALLGFISLPIVTSMLDKFRIVRDQVGDGATAPRIEIDAVSAGLALGAMVIFVWSFAVMVHVLRNALDISTAKAVFLSMLLWIVTLIMAGSLASFLLRLFAVNASPA